MADTSAFDQPEARGLRLIVATLRVAVAAQCFGMAAVRALDAGQSNLAYLLHVAKQLPVDRCVQVDQATAAILFACGMFSLTRPCWPVLLPLTTLVACEAGAVLGQGTSWRFVAQTAEQFASITLPCSLMLVDLYPPKTKFSLWRFMTVGSLTRFAASITFLAGGVLMLDDAMSGGEVVGHVQATAWTVAKQSIPDAVAAGTVAVAGTLTAAAGINLMLARSRFITLAMTVWGVCWAAAVVPQYGPLAGTAHWVSRAAFAGAPATVFLYWTLSVRERDHVILPTKVRSRGRRTPRHQPGRPHASHHTPSR